MSLRTISEICAICKTVIEPGDAIYITKVTLTKTGRTGPGDGGMSWGGAYRQNPEGKIRVKYLGNCKPKFCIHLECYENKIKGLLE